MSKYIMPHRATIKLSLSRRTRIILIASLLVPVSLLTIANLPASAAAKYATIQEVQDAISAAIAPIQSAIASLQQQQTNQAQQISNLQNSTSKSLKAYDANGQELGVVTTYQGAISTIYSPTLSRFINLIIGSQSIDGVFSPSYAYYQSPDCTGTPYEITNQTDALNTLFVIGTNGFYIVPKSATPASITTGSISWWNMSDGSHHCDPDHQTITQPTFALQQVNLPFSIPLALPLQFRYQ